MTLIVAVILTKVRICNRPATVILTKVRIRNRHPDESQNLRSLTITPIPDQVRNDGMAVTLTKIRTRNRHSDESQNLTDSESSSE